MIPGYSACIRYMTKYKPLESASNSCHNFARQCIYLPPLDGQQIRRSSGNRAESWLSSGTASWDTIIIVAQMRTHSCMATICLYGRESCNFRIKTIAPRITQPEMPRLDSRPRASVSVSIPGPGAKSMPKVMQIFPPGSFISCRLVPVKAGGCQK